MDFSLFAFDTSRKDFSQLNKPAENQQTLEHINFIECELDTQGNNKTIPDTNRESTATAKKICKPKKLKIKLKKKQDLKVKLAELRSSLKDNKAKFKERKKELKNLSKLSTLLSLDLVCYCQDCKTFYSTRKNYIDPNKKQLFEALECEKEIVNLSLSTCSSSIIINKDFSVLNKNLETNRVIKKGSLDRKYHSNILLCQYNYNIGLPQIEFFKSCADCSFKLCSKHFKDQTSTSCNKCVDKNKCAACLEPLSGRLNIHRCSKHFKNFCESCSRFCHLCFDYKFICCEMLCNNVKKHQSEYCESCGNSNYENIFCHWCLKTYCGGCYVNCTYCKSVSCVCLTAKCHNCKENYVCNKDYCRAKVFCDNGNGRVCGKCQVKCVYCGLMGCPCSFKKCSSCEKFVCKKSECSQTNFIGWIKCKICQER